MVTTPELIDTLAAGAGPVKRLRPPALQAALWIAMATVIAALAVSIHGLRPDLAQRFADPLFTTSLAGSLLTAVLAALAAFMSGLPDRSRLWLILPIPALLLWLSAIGYGCLANWIPLDEHNSVADETRCAATMVLTSLPLSLTMLAMLRAAPPLAPRPTLLSGALAVAAVVATFMALFHDHDAAAMVLLWNLAPVVLIIGPAAVLGEKLLAR